MYTTLIEASQLQALEEVIIFDCRFQLTDTQAGERAFAEGHIPSAYYLHLDRDLSSAITPESGRHPLPDPALLAGRLASVGVADSNRQVVVYDDVCGAQAARAWWLLRWLGIESVAVLNGGIQAWQQLGATLEAGAATLLPSDAVAVQTDNTQWLTTDALMAALKAQQITLVDARAANRYRGETEPLDPVAGHVPQALNRPLTDNIEQGRFKSAQQLKAEWQSLLGDVDPTTVVNMCGSGVTACHNILAMEYAGLKGAKLYAGSWSEWIRDPARPVAVGAEAGVL